MAKFKTPVLNAMRTQGGTFYTMPSATEDVGLNINERGNKVGVSHYALLDLPGTKDNTTAWKNRGSGSDNPGVMIKDELQHYMMNLETAARNETGYDYSANLTVSERAFWKWLRHEGLIDISEKVTTPSGSTYYKEKAGSEIVRGFGKVAAANYRTDDRTIYNEIYVQVPSSFGGMTAYFKKVEDDNWKTGSTFAQETGDASPYYDESGLEAYTVSDDDCMSMELDINGLRDIYGTYTNAADAHSLSMDDLAIGVDKLGIKPVAEYTFNTVLVYYSIYDSASNNILATNLFGVLFLDAPNGTSGSFTIPSLTKKKSNAAGFGNGYSFRLNLKTSSITDDTTAEISDWSTGESEITADFANVTANLSKALDLMRSNIKFNRSLNDKYDALTVKVDTVLSAISDGSAVKYAEDNHASPLTTHGAGTAKQYGHVKCVGDYMTPAEDDSAALSQDSACEMYLNLLNLCGQTAVKHIDLSDTTYFPDETKNVTITDGKMYVFDNIDGAVIRISMPANGSTEYRGQFRLKTSATVKFLYGGDELTMSGQPAEFTAGTYRYSIVDGFGVMWSQTV